MVNPKYLQPTEEEVAQSEKFNSLGSVDEPQYITPVVASANDPNFLIYSLDTDTTIEKIENELRGRVYTPETNTWTQKERPKMNDLGINALMFIIRNKLHRIAQLTALEDDDCKRITKETVLDINDAIYINWDRWGFTDDDGNPDVSDYSTVVHMIDHNIFFAIMRAKHGGERRAIRQMYSYVQKSIEGVKNKSQGMFSGLIPGRKR